MSNKKLKQIATFLNEKVLMMVTTLYILNYTEFHSFDTNAKIIWPPLSIYEKRLPKNICKFFFDNKSIVKIYLSHYMPNESKYRKVL